MIVRYFMSVIFIRLYKSSPKKKEPSSYCEAHETSFLKTIIVTIEEKIYDMKINRPFLFLLNNSMLPDGYNLVFMSKIEKFD